MGYGELRNEGIICSTEEASSPWPCDAKLRFAPGKKISRNFGAGKGPGYYVVSDGPFKSNYTAEDLVKRGYATMGVTFTLHPGDRDAYDVSSDTIPAGVKSVVRNTIQNHCYVVEYESGERKKLMIEQMEAQGFVRKK